MVIALTGGGSMILPRLIARPGASRTILEALVPYHPRALSDFLGGTVEQACSEMTSRQMAVAALERARLLTQPDPGSELQPSPPVSLAGVGCTAALATDRPRRGRDRAFLAFHTLDRTITEAMDFGHAQTGREAQERAVADQLHRLLRECGVIAQEVAADGEGAAPAALQRRELAAPPSWRDLARGSIAAVILRDAGLRSETVAPRAPVERGVALFPGSFNPLHQGHRQMAAIAVARTKRPLLFELSVVNADKPPLDYLTIADRLAPFRESDLPIVLTRCPKFAAKADLFPESVFVVGADTAIRISDPRFYGGSLPDRDAALERIARSGCRFLVFGRQSAEGFLAAELIDLPPAMRQICDPVAASQFRNDISSTALRRQG